MLKVILIVVLLSSCGHVPKMKKKIEIGKSNYVWEEWLRSEEGIDCSEGKTEGEYLKNRLWRAFMSGFDAGKE